MPHAAVKSFRLLVLLFALLALPLSLAGAATSDATSLAWHSLAPGYALNASENIIRQVHYEMNGILRSLAGGRADPVTIVEDRSQTIALDASPGCLLVKEYDVRHYGGDHPKDPSVKKRVSQARVRLDASGQLAPLPPLPTAEASSNDPTPQPGATASPATETLQNAGCTSSIAQAGPGDARRYKDPGDAALAEFPAQRVSPGDSWKFARPIRVERDLALGDMTFTNRLERVEERAGHRIAIIAVNGLGRVDVVKELQDKGFKTASMAFSGTAEFDVNDGLPLAQHYTGHVEWATRIMGARIGLVVDESYTAKRWTVQRNLEDQR